MTVLAQEASSQTVKALLSLRELILSGELKPGDRISELSVVERLGVSRTPIRMALVRLEEEGLLELIPSGGFSVKAFSERDIYDAIEVRGTLEGLAARLCAERGLTNAALGEFRECLAEIDELVASRQVTVERFSRYVDLNERFHTLLIDFADSPVLARQLKRALNLPFASHNAFVRVQAELPEALMVMTVAQDQHRCAVRAIENREGARAEAIMREHARLAIRNLEFALRNQRMRGLVPGSVLIRGRAAAMTEQHVLKSGYRFCEKGHAQAKITCVPKERNVQRTKAPFRADQVGSFLRSEPLKEARAKREKSQISAADLKKVEDTEIEKLIRKQEAIGMQLVTDGEYRRSWWHFDFLEQLGGAEGYEAAQGIQFAGVQTRARGVKVSGKLHWNGHPFVDHFKFVKDHTKVTPKMTIPAPSVLHFRGGRKGISKDVYPDLDAFFDDLAKTYKDAVAAFYAPAAATCSSTTPCGRICARRRSSISPSSAATTRPACRRSTPRSSTRRSRTARPT